MRIATAVSTAVDADDLPAQLVGDLQAGLERRSADLGILFASAHFEDRLEDLALEIHERLPMRAFVGVTAETVIGDDREYEGQPAIVMWAGHLPGAHAMAFHLSEDDLDRLDTPEAFAEHLGVTSDAMPHFLMLADPFSFSPTPALLTLLGRLHAVYPGRPVLGGLCSAAESPGENMLIFDGQTLRHGLVGVALWGNVHIDTVVSQGCRPIGQHMVVTRAERNIVYELGGERPLDVVKRLLSKVKPRDRRLLTQRGLLVGSVINEYQKDFSQGDFLIRNPLGFDPNSGAMAVNDLMRTGQTVQFQVRDSRSAAKDLDALLLRIRNTPPAGTLLFTCSGRGRNLFNHAHHDARTIHEAGSGAPLAGCFCAGEIGPVADRNFLHAHTASIGFFRPADPAQHA